MKKSISAHPSSHTHIRTSLESLTYYVRQEREEEKTNQYFSRGIFKAAMAPILGHRLLRALVAFYEKMLFLGTLMTGGDRSRSLCITLADAFVPFTMFGSHNTLTDIYLTHCIRKGGIKAQPLTALALSSPLKAGSGCS